MVGENNELSAFSSLLKVPIRDLKATVITLKETFLICSHRAKISENQTQSIPTDDHMLHKLD